MITICQGDIILSRQILETMLQLRSNDQLEQASNSLWASIKNKILVNYSHKDLKTLIDWTVEKLVLYSEKEVLSDSDLSNLHLVLEIVSLISVGRTKIEQETNSLIKFKRSYSIDLYIMLNPLLYWLQYSTENEERLHLFKAVWKAL